MAGGQERILRGRIRSMQATKKITRAMELIAASRIVKAQQRVQAAVPYSQQITEVVKDLAAAGGSTDSPLLQGRSETKNVCYVVITADRGLCGGYNAGVQRAAEGEIKADVQSGRGYEIVPVGRKAESYFKFRDYRLGRSFGGFSDNPSYEDAKEIGRHVIELYASGHVDLVELVYTRFITPGNQEVVLRPLVPLSTDTVVGGDGKAGSDDGTGADYEFEPDPTTILDTLLPRYVEARVYAALLNAAASEHAFRQRAMKSATDNADELIKNLSIIMNRARQDSITTEIMEIVGGAEALGSGNDKDVRIIDFGVDAGFGGAPAAPITPSAPSAPAGGATEPSSAGPATATLEPDQLDEGIDGIGPVIERKLNEAGVTTFKQIAQWTPDEVERIGALLNFKGRIEREDWIGQAKAAHLAKYGEQL
ncbi:MAG: F0F1 ATP synthase subunit gamma [Ilumatobacter sp.]|nr:F0F1 ATP synthase subunit gamma [Ilumatobacter sp.]MDJ0768810.1 F0F1 ATP synthase subunit gamma [Ilumatobacter sp.]